MVSKLLQQIKTVGNPLVETDQVTFVWHGKTAPVLVGDFNDWDMEHPVPLKKISANIWTYRLSLPADAYIEYNYVSDGRRIPDPYNSCLISNGVGEYNQYFYMPGATQPSSTVNDKNIPRGKITPYQVETDELAATKKRLVYLYQPPVSKPAALLVVLDGKDYLSRAGLARVVDRLVASQQIQPVAMALVDNGRKARLVEYACSEATLAFLQYKVLPLAESNLDLVRRASSPGSYGILGASMGGLMALFTGLRLPELFGRVLSQSGAFNFAGEAPLVFDLVKNNPARSLQVWMDVGIFESNLDVNRTMQNLLVSQGYPVVYQEYNAGHNYTAWGNQIGKGLAALYGQQSREEEPARE
ncbi:MAG: alpha/beta hydrolase-fold protein [Omnitrophica WOR_2 bacterium]